MKPEQEVQKLLKTIGDSINRTSISDVNDVLTQYASKKSVKNEDANIVLKEVCEEFKISLKTLMKSHQRGKIQDAKQTAYCILYHGLNLSLGYISSKIFCNNKNSVYKGILRYRNANPKIHTDKQFVETVDALKCSVLQKIKDLEK
jgi:chromosomal replication initiation ATPase DnaA